MMYAPHILQKKVVSHIERDEFGRIIGTTSDEWVDVCRCRCDDNTTNELKSENGEVYRPKYHVVCERNDIVAGDVVRCMNGTSIKGQGKVFMVKNANYYDYTEVWM